MQEVSIDFKGDLKKLYTQSQFPIATARGKLDVTGKAKIVNYDPDPINQLFWAQSIAAGIEVPVDRELQTIPNTATPAITVTNNTTWAHDNGVQFTNGPSAGALLLKVTSSPATGQYATNATPGVYLFAAVDNTNQVAISYTYTNSTRGKTITLVNQLMGYAPVVAMDMWNTFRNKVLGIRLNACTLGSWSYPSKLEDFWVSDVSFDANTDSADALGKIFADTF